MHFNLYTKWVLLIMLFTACSCSAQNNNAYLKKYGLDKNTNPFYVKLGNSLHEISDLAVNSQGDVFAHNDEAGVVYKIDPATGEILKSFQLGSLGLHGDFEGLAIVNDKFYMMESNGDIYVFGEGEDNGKVDYKIIDNPFSGKFEFEALCYDSKNNGLLLASKEYAGKKYKGFRAFFLYDLKTNKLKEEPVYLIVLKDLKERFGIKDFYPSGMEINPESGTLFVVSSKGEPAVVELSLSGELLSGQKLNKKNHTQPEGITFLKDNSMVISDEGAEGSARLTFYPVEK